MVSRHVFTLGLACLLAAPTLLYAQKAQTVTPPSSPAAVSGVSIAVADFSGQDKELGRFIADTLLTDLAQSERLHMVERAEIGKALTELKLQSTGLAEPQDVKKVGKLLGADRLIVGSYLIRDNQFLVNARLLDVRTGRVTPGGAANVSGSRDELLRLVHQLANQFHKRLTGIALPLETDRHAPLIDTSPPMPGPEPMPKDTGNEPPSEPDASGYNVGQPDSAAPPARQSPASPTGSLPASPVFNSANPGAPSFPVTPPVFSLPSNIAPTRSVTRNDMRRLLATGGRGVGNFFTQGGAAVPVSRLRALVALVQAGMPSGSLAAANPGALLGQLPDARSVPTWATGYVLTAIRRGLWPSGSALHPAETATWSFVGSLVHHLNLIARANRTRPGMKSVPAVVAQARHAVGMSGTPTLMPIRLSSDSASSTTNRDQSPRMQATIGNRQSAIEYTGLLIEARDLPVQRSMSARIVDTDGRVVYPDPGHIPDIDFLEDHGMADYYHTGVEAPRAGAHPLIARALAVSGDDIVVSVETGARILEAGRRDGFLEQWHVGILLDEGR